MAGMASLPHGNTANCSLLCERGPVSFMGISALPLTQLRVRAFDGSVRGRAITHSLCRKETSPFWGKGSDRIHNMMSKKVVINIPRNSNSSNSNGEEDNSPDKAKFVGVDPLQAGNVVQLVLVLGLTIGWISTYIFRVSNKEMTYAQQLRDYESAVMEKRLEGLTEAELEALLEQVDEEKRRLGEKVN
ncbi:uncharacterized protein LOC112178956 isoform X3 [Rosa chinensis]|uniref:uncharacterized protein LOC112178956 isoform X3 n=1 Tax=Rosa chinensis TaxID=74649 RepID=UPI001AD91A75|nr:uncharacterized protein LOC112178956 isoform X3 [Rosa chinensis]